MTKTTQIKSHDGQTITPTQIESDRFQVPYCNTKCPQFDGKRCFILGRAPDLVCEPAVDVLAREHTDMTKQLTPIDGSPAAIIVGCNTYEAMIKKLDDPRLNEEWQKVITERENLASYKDSLIKSNTALATKLVKLQGAYDVCCAARAAKDVELDTLKAELEQMRQVSYKMHEDHQRAVDGIPEDPHGGR